MKDTFNEKPHIDLVDDQTFDEKKKFNSKMNLLKKSLIQ